MVLAGLDRSLLFLLVYLNIPMKMYLDNIFFNCECFLAQYLGSLFIIVFARRVCCCCASQKLYRCFNHTYSVFCMVLNILLFNWHILTPKYHFVLVFQYSHENEPSKIIFVLQLLLYLIFMEFVYRGTILNNLCWSIFWKL